MLAYKPSWSVADSGCLKGIAKTVQRAPAVYGPSAHHVLSTTRRTIAFHDAPVKQR